MCLLFYLAGLASGYLAWRLASAPRLWDAEEEAELWKNEWLKLKKVIDGRIPEEN